MSSRLHIKPIPSTPTASETAASRAHLWYCSPMGRHRSTGPASHCTPGQIMSALGLIAEPSALTRRAVTLFSYHLATSAADARAVHALLAVTAKRLPTRTTREAC